MAPQHDSGQLDAPRAPAGTGGWDARSEELLNGGAPAAGRIPSAVDEAEPEKSRPEGTESAEDEGELTGSAVADVEAAFAAVMGTGSPARTAAPSSAPASSAPAPPPTSPAPVSPAPSAPPAEAGAEAATEEPAEASAVASTPFGGAEREAPADRPVRRAGARRGAADPVKALIHRHRELCERAVDPLEIAAGLEAHGVTDRAAARFRHRDVFSLAEEMYARVPHHGEGGGAGRAGSPSQDERPGDDAHGTPLPGEAGAGPGRDGRPGGRGTAALLLLPLLPGALCAAALLALRTLEGGQARVTAGVAGVVAVALAVRACLRHGPLRGRERSSTSTRAWVCWLLGYTLLGDGLLDTALRGGPDGLWPPRLAPALGLALAVAPAVWCARLFTVRAQRKLATSRGLEEFAGAVRPLLLGTFTLFLCALLVLLGGAGALLGEKAAYAGAGSLGALLLLARLLMAHGRPGAPAVALACAGAVELLALCSVFAGRLPGCTVLALPVEYVVTSWGPGAVPALACAAAAAALLIRAVPALSRASAHVPPGGPR